MGSWPRSHLYPHETSLTHSRYAHTDLESSSEISPLWSRSGQRMALNSAPLGTSPSSLPDACGAQRPNSHCCEFMNNDNSQAPWHIKCDQIASVPMTFSCGCGKTRLKGGEGKEKRVGLVLRSKGTLLQDESARSDVWWIHLDAELLPDCYFPHAMIYRAQYISMFPQ